MVKEHWHHVPRGLIRGGSSVQSELGKPCFGQAVGLPIRNSKLLNWDVVWGWAMSFIHVGGGSKWV